MQKKILYGQENDYIYADKDPKTSECEYMGLLPAFEQRSNTDEK